MGTHSEEKMILGSQDPGDPGVGKVMGGKGFFFLSSKGGTDPEWHYAWHMGGGRWK